MYINLINHSNYSLMNSCLTIDDIINFAIENNQKYVALVDVNTMFGTIDFYNKALKKKLKPIIGLQINYQNNKLVIIPKNKIGLSDTYKISSLINSNKFFDLSKYIGQCYLINLDNNEIDLLKSSCLKYFTISKINPIAVKENFYANGGDKVILKALSAIKEGKKLSDYENNNNFDNSNMLSDDQAKNIFSSESINNLESMIETIDILIEQQKKINFVKFNESIDSKTLLNQMVMDGLKKRKIKNDEIYLTRANTELDVINKMNLNDYFLVVQDYVNYAKKNNIYVGPGRGSAAGSLVSFLLNITGIDPIANDLIFERFLNEERETMPDIDVDFEDDQRYKVIEYIFDKYTNARTSYIITFQRMKAKMALTDVGRILEIDLKIIKMITGLFGVQYETDIMGAVKKNLKIKEYYDKYPQLFNIASKIINFPRSIGIHPAGIILCGEEITNILPTIMIDEKIITQFEAEHMEPLGLIKMDILGLSNLTIIKEIINLIKENKSYELKLEDIEIDNENVLKQMSNGDTVGIFQLESNGMTNLIRKLKPKNVEEISQVLALFRPGPMENIKVFLENKNAPNNIQYINQQFEKVLKKTYNIVVYQEQMMELIKIICNYSYAKADIFRRIISKKKIDQLALLKKDFINDAIKNNYSEEQSNKIFSYIESFADYGFNHSHSLSYAYISYWMAYLKYYYPLEFITVLLTNNNSNVDKVNQYIEEAKSLSLKVLPPSIKLSKEEFIIKNDAIIFGLNAIKGFGISKTQQILELRKKYDFKNYNQTISVFAKNNIGISTIQLLIKSGTFDELLENKSRFFLLNNLENIYNASKLLTEDGNFIINPQLDNSEPTKEILEELKIEQFNLLGFDFSINQKQVVLDEYRGNNNLVNLAFASMNEGKHKVLAKIVSIKHINTKYGAEMAFINASDESKTIRITIWPPVYKRIHEIIKENGIFIFTISNEEKGMIGLDANKYI